MRTISLLRPFPGAPPPRVPPPKSVGRSCQKLRNWCVNGVEHLSVTATTLRPTRNSHRVCRSLPLSLSLCLSLSLSLSLSPARRDTAQGCPGVPHNIYIGAPEVPQNSNFQNEKSECNITRTAITSWFYALHRTGNLESTPNPRVQVKHVEVKTRSKSTWSHMSCRRHLREKSRFRKS